MKLKSLILAVFCLMIAAVSYSQAPQRMSYQSVVRANDNTLVANTEVSMRISILHGSVDGNAVYTETHQVTTNANGLATLEIGGGETTDDFSAIDWSAGVYFVKIETDVNGGENYDITGVSQLLSVPYALYAKTAGNVPDMSGYLTEELDPTVPDWAKAETKPAYGYDEIGNTPDMSGYLTEELDPTVPDWAKAETKPAYNYDEIGNTPELFDGNYNSLTNKPELFDGNYNSLTNTPDLSGYLTSETQGLSDVVAINNSVNSQLKNVSDPTEAQDATTKAYVEALLAELRNEMLQRTSHGILNGHEYVDLGLSSGTKWATCNVGATTPEGYGSYYAWGETTTKEGYFPHSYTYSDNSDILPASADAATANWDNGWRMPTKEEFEELRNNCTWTWTTQNNVNGYLVTGPNGNYIFLPAAGYRDGSESNDVGSLGYYWSSSLDSVFSDSACFLALSSEAFNGGRVFRSYGQSVRAVCQ